MPEITAWRIDKAKRAATSFNGVGAAAEGGRWNSAGVAVVYVSEHLAMAAQEKYVHLPKPVPSSVKFVKILVTFHSDLVARVNLNTLPADWQIAPVPVSTQAIGDGWMKAGKSAVLAVPSATIPEEWNFLINPSHPDFKKIKIEAPFPFSFGYRVARLVEPPPPTTAVAVRPPKK